MKGAGRKKRSLQELAGEDAPISASKLAEQFSVTRQVIVADVAVLRASGHAILAEHRGYVLDIPKGEGLLRSIICRHGREDIRNEFYTVVDNGGSVLDIIVEHAVYGQLSATISISSRKDVDDFVRKVTLSGASQLSTLTDGIHIHTIRVPSEEAFDVICEKLSEQGLLIDRD